MPICTSPQTDNHASTQPLSFLQTGCPCCCPTNSIGALREKKPWYYNDGTLLGGHFYLVTLYMRLFLCQHAGHSAVMCCFHPHTPQMTMDSSGRWLTNTTLRGRLTLDRSLGSHHTAGTFLTNGTIPFSMAPPTGNTIDRI